MGDGLNKQRRNAFLIQAAILAHVKILFLNDDDRNGRNGREDGPNMITTNLITLTEPFNDFDHEFDWPIFWCMSIAELI